MKIYFYLSTAGIFGGSKAVIEYANRLYLAGEDVVIYLVLFALEDYLVFYVKNQTKQLFRWAKLLVPVKVVYPRFVKKVSADVHIATFWKTAQFLQNIEVRGRKFYFVQHYESLWNQPPDEVEKTYTDEFEYLVLSDWLKSVIYQKTKKEALVLVTPVTPESIRYRENKKDESGKCFRVGFNYVKKRFKGYYEFENAVLYLEKEIPEIQVVILTTERKRKFPFKNCEVWYSPPQNKLVDYYNSLDLFVCSSWYEGLGMPAMEAMNCKVPVITTDTLGCRNYARHLDTAYVIKPYSIEDIINAIKILYNDNKLRKELAEKGYKEIQKYNWDENIKKLLTFINTGR